MHSTHSDGCCTVGQTLDLLEGAGGVDIVSFTDHDEIGAWPEALAWKAAHPASRIELVWGCEVTLRGAGHLLAYAFQPPYPQSRFRGLQPFAAAVRQITEAGGVCVIPHPDQWVVGVGLARLERALDNVPVLALETHSPYVRDSARLVEFAKEHHLACIGGSDAHFAQHLLRWTTEFPGHTPADLLRALEERTTVPQQGPPTPPVPAWDIVRQQGLSLAVHPTRKLLRAVRGGA